LARTYVSLDLETTGLDPQSDAIIEIGAVRFTRDAVVDRFDTLVNPRRPIPERVRSLTGIEQSDVDSAPPIEVVAGDLERFIEGCPLIGSNVVGFDAPVLDVNGIRRGVEIYDTHDLATLLLPGLSEYGLAGLAAHLGIEMPVHHRALPDAETARTIFLGLVERAAALPPDVLSQVATWLSPTQWPWRGFFRDVWEEVAADGRAPGKPFALVRPELPPPLQSRDGERPVDVEEAQAVLASAGKRSDVLPEFEERPQQRAALRAVAEALNQGQRLLLEAGTGVGKSLAYLIPSALQGRANGSRVVVSTATINLQEQLTGKDIPAMQALLPPDGGVRACQLKGRRNYLCLRRFEALRATPDLNDDEARLASRLLIWLTGTESGDRAELRLSQGEEAIWRRVSADGAECNSDNSPFVVEGTCFLQRARRRAEGSHLVVVNHALLLSDIAYEGRVLPPYQHLVIDEAHHLEAEATRQLGFSAGEREVGELLDGAEGLRGSVGALVRSSVSALAPAGPLTGIAAAIAEAAAGARPRNKEFGRQLGAFLKEHGQPDAGGGQQPLLVNRAMRVQPGWSPVEVAWENLRLALSNVAALVGELNDALKDSDAAMMNLEIAQAEVGSLQQDARGVLEGLAAAIEREDPERIVWLELDRREGTPLVASAPLRVDELLRQRLYEGKRAVVLTGATLSAQGSFDFVRERLGLEDAHELLLDSPFDYRQAALLLVPSDMPEPDSPDYRDALARALIDLARASGGRALALFTSHAALRTAHALTREPLLAEGVEVLAQGIDGSPRHLVQALKSGTRTMVLGTASFWEGVDIAGEALSLLVIARLPFNVPTEPVFAARSAQYDDPFAQYGVPQAALRFKQGFGRLIRSRSDRGVAAVLDRRLVSKPYGAAFLDSLPPCQVREAPLRELPALTTGWLASVDRKAGG
jgi:Rad3-related DNA helicase/DNA polymerase III epsilon subunit-like protein